jgi:hypothetical protein
MRVTKDARAELLVDQDTRMSLRNARGDGRRCRASTRWGLSLGALRPAPPVKGYGAAPVMLHHAAHSHFVTRAFLDVGAEARGTARESSVQRLSSRSRAGTARAPHRTKSPWKTSCL